MKTLKHYAILPLLLLLCSCNVKPQAIDYGHDGCHYCKMTIVDKLHAAEIVTQKGKVYKFDATECMIHFLDDIDTSTIELYLSNNYSNPGELTDATKATYLISANVPSPMGAFLSGFKTEKEAKDIQDQKSGHLYTWEELLNHFN